MDIIVSKKTKSLAAKCRKKFSCIEKGGKDLCKAEKCILESVLYIKCRDGNYCNYQYSIGNNVFCGCPVRKEIYNNYQI